MSIENFTILFLGLVLLATEFYWRREFRAMKKDVAECKANNIKMMHTIAKEMVDLAEPKGLCRRLEEKVEKRTISKSSAYIVHRDGTVENVSVILSPAKTDWQGMAEQVGLGSDETKEIISQEYPHGETSYINCPEPPNGELAEFGAEPAKD